MKKALYLQAGGPTAVINLSFLGLYDELKKHKDEFELFVSTYGLSSLIEDKLKKIDTSTNFDFLKERNGAYFGSARISLKKNPEYLEKIEKTLLKRKITHLFLNGGNDTMDSASRLSSHFKKNNIDIKVIGIPKTIDNDLFGIDHTPGFASAAKFIYSSTLSIIIDDLSYKKGRINIIETMGRDNGSLAASSKLAKVFGYSPDYIYVPEAIFDIDKFIQKAKTTYEKKGHCNIVVAEGIKDKNNKLISSLETKDNFGNIQMGGLANYLTSLFPEFKTRAIELSLLQRAAFYLRNKNDCKEAYNLGRYAFKEGLKNKIDIMVAIKKDSLGRFYLASTSLKEVNIGTKSLDIKYITKEKDNIGDNFIKDYKDLIID